MAAPIFWRKKILVAKIETTYGTDASPGGADAILATDVNLKPMEGNDVSRELETPFMGAQGTIPTELHAMLSFKVELEPSGAAGTVPGWGALLRACAMAETISASTSVTYNPVSDGHESITFYTYIGNTLYAMIGAMGTCTIEVTAQGIPYLNFEFTGLFVQPSEDTRPTATLSGFKKPDVATSANTPTFTINSVAMVMRSFSLALGNQVEKRFLVGVERVLITDRAEAIQTTVEAQPLTSFNPFALSAAQTAMDVTLVHGTAAGRIATLNMPAAQMQRPQGLENAQNITEWPLRMVPLYASGNDQFTLTLT
ncbi:phage tail tube protein [Antarcticimicrobium sediminis]|uniref:Uncharacterized protein n=1 Tax=Antarcticimicrobium sediminis TaxID=2546227 RepID=A0A4V2Z8M8_9RHOB|nr:phage tail tube protein [Antarcticimicrobium sediminis]TDE40926.1 hypothetical protein E1B25_01560 [Antarcticimicrobium sediminis]